MGHGLLRDCSTIDFVHSETESPRYWEFAALHDLLHTLGMVGRPDAAFTLAEPAVRLPPHEVFLPRG